MNYDEMDAQNPHGSWREGLTRDIRFNDASAHATRHAHVGRLGSGKSFQGRDALILNTNVTEAYGKHGRRRNPIISGAGDRLRMSGKRLKEGAGAGFTRRQYLRQVFAYKRDHDGGKLHRDTPSQTEAFNTVSVKSHDPDFNVNVRPLVSYKEVNTEEKDCKYGRFRDGGRWRCAQNLNHKRGGAGEVGNRAGDEDGRQGRRMTDAAHEAAYPHLYHKQSDSEEEKDNADPGRRHHVRRASDKEASDEEEEDASDEEDDNEALKEARRKANRARERHKRNANRGSDEEFEEASDEDNGGGGGGGDFGDAAYEEKDDSDTENDEVYARRIQRAKKERARKKQAAALKQLADYNKNPPRKSSRNK
jgi:hypothetical protein